MRYRPLGDPIRTQAACQRPGGALRQVAQPLAEEAAARRAIGGDPV